MTSLHFIFFTLSDSEDSSVSGKESKVKMLSASPLWFQPSRWLPALTSLLLLLLLLAGGEGGGGGERSRPGGRHGAEGGVRGGGGALPVGGGAGSQRERRRLRPAVAALHCRLAGQQPGVILATVRPHESVVEDSELGPRAALASSAVVESLFSFFLLTTTTKTCSRMVKSKMEKEVTKTEIIKVGLGGWYKILQQSKTFF